MSTPSEWTPGKLFEISGFFWQTATLHTAVKLDIFTAIGKECLQAKEIANKIDSSQEGTRRLLNALVAMNLLGKNKSGGYNNLESTYTLLSKDSSQYTGHIIMHHHHLMEAWHRLDEAVTSGSPVKKRSSHSDEQRESFLMGMFNIASGVAPQVARAIDLSGCKHLLDLGGGPGTYAIHFCRENPELKATIFDLPTTMPFAGKTVERFNLAERINFKAGDFSSDPIPGSYDVAWISHILHGESIDECRNILQKTKGALKPGGRIMIHEFILNNSQDGPLFPALFSLNMLVDTPTGRSYSEAELLEMLAEQGFTEVKRLDFVGPNDSGIIIGFA